MHPSADGLYWTFHVLLALGASWHILLNKRQPRSALLWLLWAWMVPVGGVLLYVGLGQDRVGRAPHRPVPPVGGGAAEPLDALSAAVSGRPLRRGNRVRLLTDGNEAYPAMLSAIRRARVSVDLQSYIYDLDEVGQAVLSALEDAARRGVRVRVLVDGLAAWSARLPLKRGLKAAGGEARSYWRWNRALGQPLFNLRNHRKLLVVDACLAFTGGLNISRRYAKGPLARLRELSFLASGRPDVRDVHFALTGPLVADLAGCFEEDWAHSGGRSKPLPTAAPARLTLGAGAVGNVAARVVRSGPDEDLERFYEVLLGALSLAQRSVDLSTPYFVPDQPLLSLLRVLGYRGVKVRLHLPKESDHSFMNWSTQEFYHDLLDAGVEVWEVRAPFIHTKLAVVDGHWMAFGSSNLDNRSFRLNFELNVEARSKDLASQAGALLAQYRAHGHRVDLARLRRRTSWQRVRGAAVNLFSPYL
jgi:cardiolipin synthase